MKHNQHQTDILLKLPKTVGDSVVLGSVVALGITTINDKNLSLFASFEYNGELTSYSITLDQYYDLSDKLAESIDDSTPKITRKDIRYHCTKDGYQFRDTDNNVISEYN